MFIDGEIKFYQLILNVYQYHFLNLRVLYFTNIFLNDLHIILFLFDLVYLFLYLDQEYRIQIQTIFLLYQIILALVVQLVLKLSQIIVTFFIAIVNLPLSLLFLTKTL
jgi:hypothetical protein